MTLYKSFFNMGLRGLSMISKFFLVLFLPRWIDPTELGLYTLISTTLGFSIGFLGIEFFSYNAREIASAPDKASKYIRDQFVLHGVTYIFFIPFLIGLFFLDLLPMEYLGILLSLFIIEHLAQELHRLLIALDRAVWANFLYFFRGGMWPLAVFVLMFFDPESRELSLLLKVWLGGVFLSLFCSLFAFRKLSWRRDLKTTVDWAWIKRGIKISFPLFLSVLAYRGVFTFDQYSLKWFVNAEIVGIYGTFFNLSVTLQTFTEAGIVAIFLPKFLKNKDHPESYREIKRSFIKYLIGFNALAGAGLYFSRELLLNIIGKPLYIEYQGIFPILIGTIIIMNLSLIPHMDLFSHQRDREIIKSSLAGLTVGIISCLILIPYWSIYGAGASVSLAAITILATKSYYAKGARP